MKLTEHELAKRLDNEFDDCDFSIHECATKGTVAKVYFYEEKHEDTEPEKPKTTKEYFDECLLRWGGSVKRK